MYLIEFLFRKCKAYKYDQIYANCNHACRYIQYSFLEDFGSLFLKLPETNINITTITESSRNEKHIVHMNLGKIGLFSLIHAYAV